MHCKGILQGYINVGVRRGMGASLLLKAMSLHSSMEHVSHQEASCAETLASPAMIPVTIQDRPKMRTDVRPL